MKDFFEDFKVFAVKGNMIDMATGIIIGAAFNRIVDVLVKQVFLPPLSLLTGGVNFKEKRLILKHAVLDNSNNVITDEVAIGYGALGEAFLDFLIVAFTIFVIIRFMNKLKSKSENAKDTSVVTPKDIELLSHISELMEEQNALLKSK